MALTIERCRDIAAAERRLQAAFGERRAGQPLARVNVLVGSGLQRLYHQRRLARQIGPLAAIYFFTPADLAREIADRADLPKRTPLPPGAAPLLLDDIIRERAAAGQIRELDPNSPGLAEALHVTFTDLREGGVSAETFARFAHDRPAPADDRRIIADLAALYSAWRDRAAKLRDRPSFYEDALAQAVQPHDIAAALGGAPLIVTGMYDFTRVQRQLLALCASQVPVHVLIPAPDGDDHAAALADTLEAETDAEPRPHAPAQFTPAAAGGFSTSDPRAEAAETARRVLDAAAGGVKFHEMAILHRAGAPGDASLADALRRADIPAFVAGGQPVLHTNPGRAALRLLELLCDKPQRPQLLEFLGNPSLRARLPVGPRPKPLQWERISRSARLTSDWAEFHSHLEQHLDSLKRSDTERLYDQQATRELLAVCDDLQLRADQIAQAKTWSEAVQVVLDALNDYINDGRGRPDSDAAEDAPDDYRYLIDAIRAALNDLGGIDRIGASYTSTRLLSAARGALIKSRLRPRRALQGVLIGNAAGAARTLRFDAVFVPGMAERSFPAVPRQDPLLPDSARRELNAQIGAEALRLGQTRTRLDRLAFTLIEQAAREQLTLSYARRASAVGGPSHPSVLLTQAIGRVNGSGTAPLDEEALNKNERFQRLPAAVSEAAPRPDEDGAPVWGAEQRALDESDLRIAMLSAPGVVGHQLLLEIGGLPAERADIARRGRNSLQFTEFDGLIRPPGDLWNPFDGQRTLSATALERYAACPYRFFLANILGVHAVEEPEEGGELSVLDRGSLMHEILEAWVQGWLDKKRPDWPEYAHDPAPLLKVANTKLDEAEKKRQLGPPGIADGLRRQVLDDLEQARQAEAKRAAAEPHWRPRSVERKFENVELDAGEDDADADKKRVLIVNGRIDRVDEAPGGRRRAIDYKTGKHRRDAAEAFRSGYLMQLPLYLHAMEQDDRGELAASTAEFFYVSAKGGFQREPLDGSELAPHGTPDALTPADELEHVLETISEGIVNGAFFPFPFRSAQKKPDDTHCKWCDFQPACNSQVAPRYITKQRRNQSLTADFEQLVAKRIR